MPDEIEVPLDKSQEDILELHKERHGAEHDAGHEEHHAAPHGKTADEKDDWTKYIGVTTAFLAVIAAIGALQSGLLVNESLLQKNEQIGALTKASDQWNYYQAEGLKALIYQTSSQALPANSPAARTNLAQAKKYKDKQADISTEAKKLEAEAAAADKRSDAFLERHHIFAFSVSLCQIAIALSAIAALTKHRRIWFVSGIAGGLGLILLIYGFLR
jgi:heme/copper-type cytochrome/quinol oxidase subunit 4